MEISHQEIYLTAWNLLKHLEDGAPLRPEALALALDELALGYHFSSNTNDDEADYPDPPRNDYQTWRSVIIQCAPYLSFYNTPSATSVDIARAELLIGDAVDDLVDIACELSEFIWRWQYNSAADALWHFRFGYETHWGIHIRNLQLYLQAQKSESDHSQRNTNISPDAQTVS